MKIDNVEVRGPLVLTIQRGMQVLRAFRSERHALSNAELVRRTGLPKATISRLTSTLLQQGFIRHVPGGREFELCPAPAAIGHAYMAGNELLQIAGPALQELADKLDASVALGIRDELDMLYIGYRASARVGTLRLGAGSLLPIGSTAIGRAYLWGLAPTEREPLMAQLKEQAGDQAHEFMQSVEASFEQLENTGTCSVLEGYQRGAYGIALPLRVGLKKILLSMSCGRAHIQPKLALASRRITPALLESARRLQQDLADFDGEL